MTGSLKIVADQQITLATDAFSSFGELHLVDGRQLSANDIKDADVLLVRSVTRVNQALLNNTQIRFVGSATSGIDHIDTDYLQKQNIAFHYAAGSNARSVAEYVLSAILYLRKKYDFSLNDKTIGIVGLGHVGSCVYEIMQSLGLCCLLNDPPRAIIEPGFINTDLHELCEKSDILTFHIPLVETGPYATKELLNQGLLDKVKEEAVIINTSRGDVINEKDLLSFCDLNSRARLILDVWQNEPVINSDLLQQSDIGTPHIAGYSFDGKLKATQYLQKALAKWSGINCNTVSNSKMKNIKLERKSEGDVLYDAVAQAYDANVDSNQLKKSLDMPIEGRGQYFDELRKKYPMRREFSQTLIDGEFVTELENLGFVYE